MKAYDLKPSFAGGELTPTLAARVDLEKYAVGGRMIKNFIVLPQGGLINRPGTTVLGTGYAEVRLVPFIFSEDDSCCLAFSDGKVDVYTYTGLQKTVSGSPYRTQHLQKLRWLQSADVMYLFHPDVPVHRLERHAGGVWKFSPVEFEKGPFRDMNTDEDLKIMLARAFGGYALASSKPYFEPAMVGSLMKIEWPVKPKSGTLRMKDDGTKYVLKDFFGPFSWTTEGKWTGEIMIERCDYDDWAGKDEAAWVWKPFKIHTSKSGAETNVTFVGTVEEYSTHFRFTYKDGGGAAIAWDCEGGLVDRVVKIIRYVDPTLVEVEAMDKINGSVELTDTWAIGAFGAKSGYPSMGIFHQERLVLARTNADIQSVWMSQPASWHSFKTSIPAKDDDALAFTLASKQINEIRDLVSRTDLVILTSGSEWIAKAGAKSDVFTPSSIVITPCGYLGAHTIPALDVGSRILFIQRHGQVVRSMGYSLEQDNYAASDVSILAHHLFENNAVVNWAYQQTPWSVVWTVLKDGRVGTLTMQEEHQMQAWSQQDLSGRVKDVCAIPGDSQDDVYFAVSRGGQVNIERLKRRDLKPQTFKDADTIAVVSTLECLEWEIPAGNTLQGRHKFMSNLTLRLYETLYLKAGVMTEMNDLLDELKFPGQLSPGASLTPFTGDVRIELPGGMSRVCRLKLENDRALPVTILGLFPEVDVYETQQ